MRRKLGDRRVRPRYDIVGEMWGSLETVLRLGLRNLSPGGALIESHVPLPAESVHRLTFSCAGQNAAAQVRVRHVKPMRSIDGEQTYLIGVEFVTMHPALVDQIVQWMVANGDEPTVVAKG